MGMYTAALACVHNHQMLLLDACETAAGYMLHAGKKAVLAGPTEYSRVSPSHHSSVRRAFIESRLINIAPIIARSISHELHWPWHQCAVLLTRVGLLHH